MRDVTPCLGLSLLLVLCMTACMLQEPPLPSAIPAERQPIWGDEPEMVPQVPPETLPPPGATQGTPPRLMPPPMQESPPLPEAPRKPVRLEPPAKILRDANKAALVSPQRRGFFGGRAEQRYIYQPGKVYLVISSPNHPTSLLMPPGERLAAAPIVNQCTQESESPGTETGCWVVGTTEMGSETTRQELVILRPTKAGLESTMPLFTSSGLAFYVRLRSQDEMGMIAVTWELPRVHVASVPPEMLHTARTLAGQARGGVPEPVINLERLYTAYTIAVTSKQRPPWVPVQVFDDGSRTYIRFKEDLGFTASPAVFGVHADRTPAVAEFTPYTSPQGTLTYIVSGLQPQWLLKGTDGQEVTITRGANNAR